MKQESLRQRLVRFLYKQHGWVSSAAIQKVVLEHSSYLPRTAIRRLQEAVEDGELEVQIRGKMAWYKVKDGTNIPPPPNKEFIPGLGHLKSYEQLEKEGVV